MDRGDNPMMPGDLDSDGGDSVNDATDDVLAMLAGMSDPAPAPAAGAPTPPLTPSAGTANSDALALLAGLDDDDDDNDDDVRTFSGVSIPRDGVDGKPGFAAGTVIAPALGGGDAGVSSDSSSSSSSSSTGSDGGSSSSSDGYTLVVHNGASHVTDLANDLAASSAMNLLDGLAGNRSDDVGASSGSNSGSSSSSSSSNSGDGGDDAGADSDDDLIGLFDMLPDHGSHDVNSDSCGMPVVGDDSDDDDPLATLAALGGDVYTLPTTVTGAGNPLHDLVSLTGSGNGDDKTALTGDGDDDDKNDNPLASLAALTGDGDDDDDKDNNPLASLAALTGDGDDDDNSLATLAALTGDSDDDDDKNDNPLVTAGRIDLNALATADDPANAPDDDPMAIIQGRGAIDTSLSGLAGLASPNAPTSDSSTGTTFFCLRWERNNPLAHQYAKTRTPTRHTVEPTSGGAALPATARRRGVLPPRLDTSRAGDTNPLSELNSLLAPTPSPTTGDGGETTSQATATTPVDPLVSLNDMLAPTPPADPTATIANPPGSDPKPGIRLKPIPSNAPAEASPASRKPRRDSTPLSFNFDDTGKGALFVRPFNSYFFFFSC